MNIAVIGAGYVGLVSAVGLALRGNKVICVDTDERKINSINSKASPIYEEGLEKELQNLVPARLSATMDLGSAVLESDAIFICVGTPSKPSGAEDLSALKKCVKSIGSALRKKKDYCVVVVKSTVLPKITEELVLPLLEKSSGKRCGSDFGLCMNPEFLKEGVALKDFMQPDRIVIGCIDFRTEEKMRELYSGFNAPMLSMKPRDAEMTKLASNCFLASKISFVNELANLSKKIGVDICAVTNGMGHDKRIAPYFLKPGPGFGGSCFPKDLVAMKKFGKSHKEKMRMISATIEANTSQPERFLEFAKSKANLADSRVGVLGLSFKPGTDDVRESPAIPIIRALSSEAKAVNAYDPKAEWNMKRVFPEINYFSSALEVIGNSDVVLIVTDWPEFSGLDFEGKLVLDARNIFEGKQKPKNYECLVK